MDLTVLPVWGRLLAVAAVLVVSVGFGLFHPGAGLVAAGVGCVWLLVSAVPVGKVEGG